MLFLGQWDSNTFPGYSLNEENYDGYFFLNVQKNARCIPVWIWNSSFLGMMSWWKQKKCDDKLDFKTQNEGSKARNFKYGVL